MKKYIRINLTLYRNAFLRDLKIPGVVISSLLMELTEIAVSIIFFNLIFANVQSLGGWSYWQVLFLYAYAKVLVGLHQSWTRLGIRSMAESMIRQGDLDFYLTKPVNAMFLVSISKPRIYSLLNASFSIALGVYALLHTDVQFSIINTFWFIIVGILGFILYYFLQFLTVIPVFWLIRLWSLRDIINRLSQFSRYPAGVFSRSMKALLFVFFPVLATTYVPVSMLFEKPDWKIILYMFVITVVFAIITTSFWKLGLRKYGSASS